MPCFPTPVTADSAYISESKAYSGPSLIIKTWSHFSPLSWNSICGAPTLIELTVVSIKSYPG